MQFITQWLYVALTVSITSVFGYPGFRPETSKPDLEALCNSEAVRTVLNSLKQPAVTTLDIIRKEPNAVLHNTIDEDTINALLDILEGVEAGDDDVDAIGERFQRDVNIELLLQNRIVDNLKTKLQGLQKECKMAFSPNGRGLMRDELDEEGETIFDKNNILGHATERKKVADVDNLQNQFPAKRAKLGLNPTGWRKRRSQSNDDDRTEQFLRNMRQLLEKRERRLEFNPTGW